MINIDSEKNLKMLKDKLSEVIDSRLNEIDINESSEMVKKMDFGKLKFIMESCFVDLFETKEGKSIMKRYLKSINEDKSLKRFYQVSVMLKETNGVDAPETFVNECISLLNTTVDDAKKVQKIVSEAVKVLGIGKAKLNAILESYNNSLDSSISYVLLNEKRLSNVKEYSKNIHLIKENVSKAESINESATINEENLVNNLNTIISERENEWEKKALSDYSLCMLSGKDGRDLFESYKNECIEILNNKIDESDEVSEKSELYSLREGLNAKEYNKDTFVDDIFKLSELKETINK